MNKSPLRVWRVARDPGQAYWVVAARIDDKGVFRDERSREVSPEIARKFVDAMLKEKHHRCFVSSLTRYNLPT